MSKPSLVCINHYKDCLSALHFSKRLRNRDNLYLRQMGQESGLGDQLMSKLPMNHSFLPKNNYFFLMFWETISMRKITITFIIHVYCTSTVFEAVDLFASIGQTTHFEKRTLNLIHPNKFKLTGIHRNSNHLKLLVLWTWLSGK